MKDNIPVSASRLPADAMALMQQALQWLDESDAPADIGAHLDLAIVRLDQWLSKSTLDFEPEESVESAKGLASRLQGPGMG